MPADRRWYRNRAVTNLLREHHEEMHLQWPQADPSRRESSSSSSFDVAEERRRLLGG